MTDEVKVEQGDFEAAAAYYSTRIFGGTKKLELERLLSEYANGRLDPLVLLLARHRLAPAPPRPGRGCGGG